MSEHTCIRGRDCRLLAASQGQGNKLPNHTNLQDTPLSQRQMVEVAELSLAFAIISLFSKGYLCCSLYSDQEHPNILGLDFGHQTGWPICRRELDLVAWAGSVPVNLLHIETLNSWEPTSHVAIQRQDCGMQSVETRIFHKTSQQWWKRQWHRLGRFESWGHHLEACAFNYDFGARGESLLHYQN